MTWLPTVVAFIGMIWVAVAIVSFIVNFADWSVSRSRFYPNHDATTAAARRALMAWAWPITAIRAVTATIRHLTDDAKH